MIKIISGIIRNVNGYKFRLIGILIYTLTYISQFYIINKKLTEIITNLNVAKSFYEKTKKLNKDLVMLYIGQ